MNDPVAALVAAHAEVGTEVVDVAAARSATFDHFFRQEYGPMVQLATLLLGSRADAEDVVQESLARVEARWSRLQADSPGGYLRRCVVNRSTDLLRRRRIEQRFGLLRQPTTQDLGADELLDVIASLAPKPRAAIVLRYYLGLKQDEIAQVLGVRPGTVKSMLHRALARMREDIER
jgi:RNA polymerase sigma factor (sigma-70 family)